MKTPPKIILIIGILGLLASVFNYFRGETAWYANLFSLISSLGLIVVYLYTKKRSKEK